MLTGSFQAFLSKGCSVVSATVVRYDVTFSIAFSVVTSIVFRVIFIHVKSTRLHAKSHFIILLFCTNLFLKTFPFVHILFKEILLFHALITFEDFSLILFCHSFINHFILESCLQDCFCFKNLFRHFLRRGFTKVSVINDSFDVAGKEKVLVT